MIPDFSIQIEFNKSSSKFYGEVIRLCSGFDEFTQGEKNTLDTNRDEVYAKWDQFNSVFWKTVDWKGSTLSYNGSTFGAHSDKTRIFYAIQDNRLNHICEVVDQIKRNTTVPPAIDVSDILKLCN